MSAIAGEVPGGPVPEPSEVFAVAGEVHEGCLRLVATCPQCHGQVHLREVWLASVLKLRGFAPAVLTVEVGDIPVVEHICDPEAAAAVLASRQAPTP